MPDTKTALGMEVSVPDLRTITQAEICALLQICRDTLWNMRRAGDFPAPLRIRSSRLRWRYTDVQAWMERRGAGAPDA